jgi:hypothetical protein
MINEDKDLNSEFEQFKKNAGIVDVNKEFKNESFLNSPTRYTNTPTTVNSIADDKNITQQQPWGNMKGSTGALKPEEALKIAIERVLSSGAPVNNISLYDEVNWNLQKLGFDAKLPIDIKNAILKMIDRGE